MQLCWCCVLAPKFLCVPRSDGHLSKLVLHSLICGRKQQRQLTAFQLSGRRILVVLDLHYTFPTQSSSRRNPFSALLRPHFRTGLINLLHARTKPNNTPCNVPSAPWKPCEDQPQPHYHQHHRRPLPSMQKKRFAANLGLNRNSTDKRRSGRVCGADNSEWSKNN